MNYTKNFGFKHKAGILMPISALPSKYSIGSLGKPAHDFIDFLDATGQKCWQVLPLNPTSFGDSPYQSPATAAGNPYFIDLDILASKRLLTKKELSEHRDTRPKIDYGYLFNTRYTLLRLAHSRFVPDAAYRRFVKSSGLWLENYALFMALKRRHSDAPWTLWDSRYRRYENAISHKDEFEEEMNFWRWVQYEFDAQWRSVIDHAHEKGIMIIGDMPIYVAHDSVDAWASPEQFLLDENYNPTAVAGCPPDGFSPDGQLWGNPIYNWELMGRDGFSWWIERIGAAQRMYDILRIDHFRGFAGYYSIPYGEETARDGKWNSAPGASLFKAISNAYPKAKIVAEDLGFITDDVRELLSLTGFPGMKMLQFAFGENDNEYLPRMFQSPNCVVYTSSHDSECAYSWCKALSGEAKRRFNKECPTNKSQSRTYDLIELALGSIANLAVIPMQDYLMLPDEKGRINTPSRALGNWTWRMSPRYDTEKLRNSIIALMKKTSRGK